MFNVMNIYEFILILIAISFLIYLANKLEKIYEKDYYNTGIGLLKYANRMSSLSHMGGIDSTSERIVLGNFHHLVGVRNPSYSERELIRFCNIILSKRNIRTIKIRD